MKFNPQQIMNRLVELNKELANKNSELQELAENMAEREKQFKILYAEEILKMKNEGYAITLIRDIVNGRKGVAEAKLNWQVSEAIYGITREKIKAIVIHIDTLRSILTWLRAEMKNAGLYGEQELK